MSGAGVLPNAFVGGAQKSGTTTLHRLLETHPQIFFPKRPQEIHFFDLESAYRRGLGWYQGLFADWRGERVIAQTSPLYLYHPRVAERIAAVAPGARFLFLLRNPVDRAYSHYWHERRYGWESLPFEQALAAEPERLRGGEEARRHYSYLDRGRYAHQLARYLDRFPREQILVLLYDQLTADLAGLGARAAAFLGVDPASLVLPPSGEARRHNPAHLPRWPALQRATRGLREPLPRLAWLVDRLNLVEARYPPMKPETRERLAADFASEAEALKRLVGLETGHWFGPRLER